MSSFKKQCKDCGKPFLIRFPSLSHLKFCSLHCFHEWSKQHPEEKFWKKVNKNGPVAKCRPDLGQCWLWTGALSSGGYGNFWDGASVVSAHVFAYKLTHGSDAPGLEYDHLCRVRSCIRDTHLEPVTHQENCIRGSPPNMVTHRTKICRNGHVDDFILRSDGRRRCRPCYLAWRERSLRTAIQEREAKKKAKK
jgi:hypothetical protein